VHLVLPRKLLTSIGLAVVPLVPGWIDLKYKRSYTVHPMPSRPFQLCGRAHLVLGLLWKSD
jgi:hypothetical protein